jgi:hypothetical protein
MNSLPIALLTPKPEVMINCLPRAKVPRQQSPSASSPNQIKQSVADPAAISGRATAPAPGWTRRQDGLQQVPLFITQISRIQDVTHPANLATPLGQWLSICLKNVFSDTL